MADMDTLAECPQWVDVVAFEFAKINHEGVTVPPVAPVTKIDIDVRGPETHGLESSVRLGDSSRILSRIVRTSAADFCSISGATGRSILVR